MIKRKINTLRSLSRLGFETFLITITILPVMTILLKAVSYKILVGWFTPRSDFPAPPEVPREQRKKILSEIERGFLVGYKYSLLKGSCLSRSMVLKRLLARKGIGSKVVIGVRKAGENFGAHAWLVTDGEIFGPDSASSDSFVIIE